MDHADLINRFTYHSPTGSQPETYAKIRSEALKFALLLNDAVPEGREKALAITNLEAATFWANAGIARAPESVA